MMKLYWAPQSRAIRILWLLEETGVAYEREIVDIRAGGQDTPAFRRINPMGKVPALTDGDAAISESAAICAYVAERLPEARLAPPVGDPRRADYLRWLFFSAGCVEPSFLQKMRGIELPKMSAGWGSFDLVMEVLDGALAKGPFLLGEEFSAADVMIAMDLLFGITLLKIITPTPAMTAYVERCTRRPAFQRAQAIEAEALAAG